MRSARVKLTICFGFVASTVWIRRSKFHPGGRGFAEAALVEGN